MVNKSNVTAKVIEIRHTEFVPEWVHRDPEWAAVITILSAPILQRKGIMDFVDFDRQRIHWNEIEEMTKPWSRGEQILLRIAQNLYCGDAEVSLAEIANTLDSENWKLFLLALYRRRGQMTLDTGKTSWS